MSAGGISAAHDDGGKVVARTRFSNEFFVFSFFLSFFQVHPMCWFCGTCFGAMTFGIKQTKITSSIDHPISQLPYCNQVTSNLKITTFSLSRIKDFRLEIRAAFKFQWPAVLAAKLVEGQLFLPNKIEFSSIENADAIFVIATLLLWVLWIPYVGSYLIWFTRNYVYRITFLR